MDGDWRLRGREFESQQRTLDGSFFTFTCCNIVLLFRKTENKCQIGHLQKLVGNLNLIHVLLQQVEQAVEVILLVRQNAVLVGAEKNSF